MQYRTSGRAQRRRMASRWKQLKLGQFWCRLRLRTGGISRSLGFSHCQSTVTVLGNSEVGTVDDFNVYMELGRFFEVFGFGEKLKAAEKTKIVRAPWIKLGRAKRGLGFTLPNKKEWSWF